LNEALPHGVVHHVNPFTLKILIGAQEAIKTAALPFPRLRAKGFPQPSFESMREISNRQIPVFDWRNYPVCVIGHNDPG